MISEYLEKIKKKDKEINSFIEVNEKGSEAAAATVIDMDDESMGMSDDEC